MSETPESGNDERKLRLDVMDELVAAIHRGELRLISKTPYVLNGATLYRCEFEETGLTCTGLSAAWYPIHGDCTCPDEHAPDTAAFGWKDLNDETCPLHSTRSSHAVAAFDGGPGGG